MQLKVIMENFSPSTLKNFINSTPPERSSSHNSDLDKARTNRAKNITEILRNSQSMNKKEKINLDTLIRQNMGELVRTYVQAGQLDELKGLMKEHKQFIDDILNMISNNRPKN